jgi:multiple antibiotic resistance protein
MGADTRPAPDSESGTSSPDPGKDIVFFPLTMPFTTGPGSISVAIALASERPAEGEGTLTFFAGLTLAAITIAAVVWAVYAFADRVLRRFGEGGIRVVGRLSAFLLLCIGVQIIGSHPP